MKVHDELVNDGVKTEILSIHRNYNNHPSAKHIRRYLFKYNLDQSLISDVLHEVYIRFTRNKKPIDNPQAWVKVVALNVIREMKREQQRIAPDDIDDDHSPLHQLALDSEHEVDEVFIKDHPIDFYSDELSKAWESLSQDQRLILTMRILEDKSWKQVSLALSLLAAKPVSESTARQKGNRALAALKQQFDISN